MFYPSFFPRMPVRGAYPGREMRHKVYNRTGSDLVANRIYQLDMSKSQSETTNFLWDDPASVWRNIVAVGTETATSGILAAAPVKDFFFVVSTNTAADNTECEVIIAGQCTIPLIGGANTVYPSGSSFAPTTGQAYGTLGAAATSKPIGYTLAESSNYGTTPAATDVAVYFYGWGIWLGG